MTQSAELTAWATRLGEDGTARHAVLADLMNRGQRRVQSADLAEDCVQDALVAVLGRGQREQLPTFGGYEHFRNYVIRSAINRGRQLFRSCRGVFQQWDGEEAVAATAAEVTAETIRQTVDRLPPAQRQVIERYYYDGLTLDELAEVVLPPDDRSANARRLDAFKTRRAAEDRLRAMLADDAAEP